MTDEPEAGPPAVSSALSEILAMLAPGVQQPISELHEEVWNTVEPEILELCRLRIAALLGDDGEAQRRAPAARSASLTEEKIRDLRYWPDSKRFSEAEKACLAFTEQFVGDVRGITKEDADAVLVHLDPEAFYGFVIALLVLDGHQRLMLASNRVLDMEKDL